MTTLTKALLSYLKRPALVSIPKNTGQPLLLLLRLAAICIFTGVSAGLFSGLLVKLKLIPDPGPSILDHKDVSHFAFFMGAVFIAPLMEELIFRAQLRRFTGFILFIAFACGILLTAITGTYWAFLISPFIFTLLFVIYRYTLASSIGRKFRFWRWVFPCHFYFTAVCFALVHLSNFERGTALIPLGILYTLPQFTIGLVLGFTRMRYGLRYSIALHSLYNLSLAILLFSKY